MYQHGNARSLPCRIWMPLATASRFTIRICEDWAQTVSAASTVKATGPTSQLRDRLWL